MLDLTGCAQIADLDRPDLKAPPHNPVTPPRLLPPDEDEPADVFAAIRAGDILVHHPYESFSASVERFLDQAADDPDVLTIKQTLYRTSGDSPIVQALIRAAERGKQVVVLVEIKARFDEENNIIWARKLEQAGAHVVYGLVGLKTHSKTALVVRREGHGLRRYCHIGTGNYNPKTARLYVDLGLLDLPPGARRGRHRPVQRPHRALPPARLPAPARRADDPALAVPRAGRARGRRTPAPATRRASSSRSTRSWTTQVVEALYEASRAGVQCDLIVRGACCLVPGLPGVSENITVRSIVGEFLEHSRIWMFHNGGRSEWYIGSADLMERNLDRRVEVVTPVEDGEARARMRRIIEVMLADDRRSWQLGKDGRWNRIEVLESREGTVDTFAVLKEDAAASTAVSSSLPSRPHHLAAAWRSRPKATRCAPTTTARPRSRR